MKNWCFQIVVLEKTLDTPLDSKEIKPVNPKGNQPWIFTRRTDAEVEAPILDGKSWLIEKMEKKGVTEWDGWMISFTQWTWVWANSGRCWRTGKPGMLLSMRLQRVRHDWATESSNIRGYLKRWLNKMSVSPHMGHRLLDFHFWSNMSWSIFLSSA